MIFKLCTQITCGGALSLDNLNVFSFVFEQFLFQKKALRLILLTGTPALSRPSELYSQIRIINSKVFPNYRDFAVRYCDGKQGRFCFEAKGCTNSEELSLILTNCIMLR